MFQSKYLTYIDSILSSLKINDDVKILHGYQIFTGQKLTEAEFMNAQRAHDEKLLHLMHIKMSQNIKTHLLLSNLSFSRHNVYIL